MNATEKILITGGSGFLGSRVARKCVAEGYDAYLLTRDTSDPWRIKDIAPRAHIVLGNIADANGVAEIFKDIQPTGVFHLAASGIMSGKTAPAREIVEANVMGTVHVIDAACAPRLKFFVHTGSFLEYEKKETPIKESDQCAPSELYSISKLAGTLYARAVALLKAMPVVALRIFTPYGPANQRGRLASEVIVRALRGDDIALTDRRVSRDFIFADDLADLCLEAAKKAGQYKGEIFNAGSGSATDIGRFVDAVISITGSKSKVLWNALPAVSYDASLWQADMAKTFSHFDWRPRHSLEQGLAETIAWYKNNLDRYV